MGGGSGAIPRLTTMKHPVIIFTSSDKRCHNYGHELIVPASVSTKEMEDDAAAFFGCYKKDLRSKSSWMSERKLKKIAKDSEDFQP